VVEELPEEENKPAVEEHPKEEEKKTEVEVENKAKDIKIKSEIRVIDITEPADYAEYMDEKAQEQAAKLGFVPGVPVFYRESFNHKWQIVRIYFGRGDVYADVKDADGEREWILVCDLTLAEPPSPTGVKIEEVCDEEDNKPTEKENQQVKKPVTLADFTDADVGL
jgi:hypothetical protein